MRALALLIPLLLLVPTTTLAEGCTLTTSDPEIDTGPTPEGQYYVDNDPCFLDCILVLWVYEETNGYDGLQRGDQVRDDTCGGQWPADTIVNF